MLTFRAKIILFALFLTMIVAVPSVFLLVQLPWDELRSLIYRSNNVLSTLQVAINKEDAGKINRFTFEAIELVPEKAAELGTPLEQLDVDSFSYAAPSMSFYMLLDHDRLLDKEEILKVFEEEEIVYDDFNYQLLGSWFDFWQLQFQHEKEALESFRSVRSLFVEVVDAAQKTGLEISDLYIMLDAYELNSGYFKNNLAYVLESLPWWDNTYPGEPFDMVNNESTDWRQSYHHEQGGVLGHHHNLVHDPENWYLPAFDSDEWGTWFTVWLATAEAGHPETAYNIFNIDFEAGLVITVMRQIAIGIALIVVFLLVIFIYLASVISKRLTGPIRDLTEGVDAVMDRRFDHQVPSDTRDEFHHLIQVFNQMVLSVKHMVNLKETLSRLLSDELAEQAAEKGLSLGGARTECSIMFTDFAGFSTLSSHMSAEKAVKLLNHYFEALIPIVKKWGGFPDKYIGDAIVAIFGAPVQFEDHAQRAVNCAVDMQRKIREINSSLINEDEEFFHMRIGINTGSVVVGAIGCDLKLEFTSIGEATNLANRMEAACPIGHVMMSSITWEKCKNGFPENVTVPETPDRVSVKGYLEAVEAYPVWIDDVRIDKNMDGKNAREFYLLS